MLRALEDYVCRTMDRDSAWWGLRRLKPAPDRPYTSVTLLLVCLAYGIPVAAIVYVMGYAVSLALSAANPLVDDTGWFPRAAAWAVFVFHSLLQAYGCWVWNRRGMRLAPEEFRYGRRPSTHGTSPNSTAA